MEIYVEALYVGCFNIMGHYYNYFYYHEVYTRNPFAKEGPMPPAVYNNLQRHYNLDKPEIVQYGMYLKALVQLDFGPSMKSQSLTVNDYIKKGFPVSLHLGLQALLIAVTLGLVLGVIASLNRNRWPDYLSMMLAIIGISVPSFILSNFSY